MNVNTITIDYRKSAPAKKVETYSLGRYLRNDQVQRGFIRSKSAVNTSGRSTGTNPLFYLFQVPQTTMLASRSARKLMGNRKSQRRGIQTYQRTSDLFKQRGLSLSKTADLYKKSNPALQRNITLLTKNPGQSSLFSNSPLAISNLMRQGINQYIQIDKDGTSSNSLRRSAGQYLRTGPKFLQESQLFRQF